VLQLKEFREITLFDEPAPPSPRARRQPRVTIPQTQRHAERVAMSPLRVDERRPADDVFAIHLTKAQSAVRLARRRVQPRRNWRMVDRIRIGDNGYAMVIAPDGTLIAHGDPDKKALIAQRRTCRRTRCRRGSR